MTFTEIGSQMIHNRKRFDLYDDLVRMKQLASEIHRKMERYYFAPMTYHHPDNPNSSVFAILPLEHRQKLRDGLATERNNRRSEIVPLATEYLALRKKHGLEKPDDRTMNPLAPELPMLRGIRKGEHWLAYWIHTFEPEDIPVILPVLVGGYQMFAELLDKATKPVETDSGLNGATVERLEDTPSFFFTAKSLWRAVACYENPTPRWDWRHVLTTVEMASVVRTADRFEIPHRAPPENPTLEEAHIFAAELYAAAATKIGPLSEPEAETDQESEAEQPSTELTKDEKIIRAVTILKNGPNRSMRDIAADVGLNHGVLSRNPLFQAARKMTSGKSPPKGVRRESDGDVEAVDDHDDD